VKDFNYFRGDMCQTPSNHLSNSVQDLSDEWQQEYHTLEKLTVKSKHQEKQLS